MKILLNKTHKLKPEDVTEYLVKDTILNVDQYSTKEYILSCSKDIVLDDFEFGTNEAGLYAFSFSTPNYKYLDIKSGVSWSSYDVTDPDNSKSNSTGISISTYEKYWDKTHARSIATVELYFVPESEEESQLIKNSRIVSLPLKWGYQVVIVPYSEFGIDDGEDDEDDGISKTLEPDMVYTFTEN